MALTNYGFLAQDTIGNPSKIEGNPPPLPELNPRCAAEGRFPNQLRIKDLKKESDARTPENSTKNNSLASRRLCDTSDMTRINHEEGDAETADVANLGEAVGTLSLSPAASEPATIDPSDESFSRGSETSSGPTIRLFIGDLHRSTTEVSRRLHVEALSNNALLWRSYDLAEAPCYPIPPNIGCTTV